MNASDGTDLFTYRRHGKEGVELRVRRRDGQAGVELGFRGYVWRTRTFDELNKLNGLIFQARWVNGHGTLASQVHKIRFA